MSAERRAFIVIGALLAVATAAVFTSVATPAPHTGGDNAGYLSLAYSLVSGEGYTELWDPARPAHTKYPPVFPLMLGALMLSGASGWMAFKLMMAVLMSLSVLLVFVWISERTSPLFAGAVALITLLSSGWLQASRWILSEPAFLVFTFLALWAAGRSEREPGRPSVNGWLTLACTAAILAFFTRSAGLPLLLALAASLFLARRIRALGVFLGCLAIPGAWWWIRVRRGVQGGYQSEFWMVNPYEPEAGTIGWISLPARAWANLRLYVGTVLPREWWPQAGGGLLVILGVVLAALAVWGWAERTRRHRTTPELFVPLYLGLILVWPEVWSGDRFLLPLYPFILLYAGESVARLGRTVGPAWASVAASAAFLVLLVPALPGWLSTASDANACRSSELSSDPVRCQGSAFEEFRNAAVWAGANLPADAVVLSRKPRVFYLFGGPSGRTFPFTQDPDRFLAEADNIGAQHLVLDHIDAVSLFYLPSVLTGRPLAFCHMVGWGGDGGPGTEIFAILPPDRRLSGGDLRQLQICPDSYRKVPEVQPLIDGTRIPRIASP